MAMSERETQRRLQGDVYQCFERHRRRRTDELGQRLSFRHRLHDIRVVLRMASTKNPRELRESKRYCQIESLIVLAYAPYQSFHASAGVERLKKRVVGALV